MNGLSEQSPSTCNPAKIGIFCRYGAVAITSLVGEIAT